jgi:hypothetical protein
MSSASPLLVISLLFSLAACAPAKALTDTPIPPESLTAAAMQTEDAINHQAALTTTARQAELEKVATSQVAQTQTEAALPTATRTPTPTTIPTPTITPNLQATQQYEAMFAKIEQYAKDGYITSTNGTYRRLPDYQDSLAQINYYRLYPTGLEPDNFVIESDLEYESASDTANWYESGCGYVFHGASDDDHYVVFLVMDGHVMSAAVSAGAFYPMGDAYFGKLDIPKGKVHIALAVDGRQYTFFVNGKPVKKYEGFLDRLTSGQLEYSIISGSNKDFGTSCKFTNNELWVVNP